MESVIFQTYKDLEILVVDDASSDSSYQVALNYSNKDSRVKVYKNESNMGAYLNSIKCMELASGSFIKFVCADDVLDTKAISKFVAAFNTNEHIALTTSKFDLIDSKDSKLPDNENSKQISDDSFYISGKEFGDYLLSKTINSIGSPTATMFKKSCLFADANSYILNKTERKPMFDMYWWIMIMANSDFAFISDTLSYSRMHSEMSTFSPGASARLNNTWIELLNFAQSLGYLNNESTRLKAYCSLLVSNILCLIRLVVKAESKDNKLLISKSIKITLTKILKA